MSDTKLFYDFILGKMRICTDTTLISSIVDIIYPIGHILTTTNSANPSTYLGVGTWSTFGAGRTVVGIDTSDTAFDTIEETGGEKTHKLTIEEMPAHTHTYSDTYNVQSLPNGSGSTACDEIERGETTDSTGGGLVHNNLQPYIVVYMWKRTA